jgi:aspartyl-tRNA(Asn)/glutamyl-tRNA(Gln) amidotransferase subunit A
MAMHFETIIEVGKKIRKGDITASALTEIMLDRIEEQNANLNAYITVTVELAREQAKQADSELSKGYDRGPLHGIPIAIKDLFATKGIRTTCGSKLFEDWIPDYDAAVVTRLQEAGAVLLGKTGLHELANGNTSINPHFGPVRNPVANDCDPGGSSGGSASAVAAGLAFAALGTDTACSVRQPAHCCGIVGFKPTFGLVSKRGAS